MLADDKLAPWLADAVLDIGDRKIAGAGVRAMSTREREFPSQAAMLLAGIAMVPAARRLLDEKITAHWRGRQFGRIDRIGEAGLYGRDAAVPAQSEVVIGSGYHAAVYAAARVRAGFPAPWVLDRVSAERIGGAFAMSTEPAFWLNSENRPGRSGLPKDGGALNNIPGAMLQPSFISGREFPTNADMAFLIRVTLAQFARVVPEVTVNAITEEAGFPRVAYDETDADLYGSPVACGRVIDARGMGDENGAKLADGELVMTFSQLMAQADGDFPFRGMDRVALIGDGDGAKCAAEALMGIGPGGQMRTAALDGYPKVDWYAPKLPVDNMAWRMGQRGRYQRLSSYLPLRITDEFDYYDGDEETNTVTYTAEAYHDITVIPESGAVTKMGNSVLVNGREYSHAVLCTGYTRPDLMSGQRGTVIYTPGNSAAIARRYSSRVFAVGVAAGLEFDTRDLTSGVSDITNNKVAMFRLGGKTAQLAAQLPGASQESAG